ncbi:sirohydrochlorin chelatase [Rubripirellula amarantea]|uniref:sirohydrochlorin chelatase n=1 Tax=Rubripirellula amarantea TaxID=2527999 RepID=UPI001F5EFF80|nr:sirohydrochlorin chelatase [Rubripirellula amarantea]
MSFDQTQSKSGVLLVGHGTRDAIGTDEFFALSRLLDQRLGSIPVKPALLEFQSPTIPEAWKALLDQAVTQIHVAPLLLFAAGHAKSDIPEVVEQCQLGERQIPFDQSRPLSRHPAVIELVVRRLNETMNRVGINSESTAVVMVGRGNRDPCAQTDMRVLSEIVRHRIMVQNVQTAFYAMAEPSLPTVLERVAKTGNVKHIIIHPHLLFHGRLFEAIVKQTEDASRNFPNIRFVTSDYLGPDPLIAQAIADRVLANA